jgi:hypothetical protein
MVLVINVNKTKGKKIPGKLLSHFAVPVSFLQVREDPDLFRTDLSVF